MPVTSYQNAKDEMFAIVQTAYATAQSALALSYAPDIYWPLDEKKTQTDLTRYWARVSTQMVLEQQAALGNLEVNSARMYNSAGLIFVQCFGPMAGDPKVTTRLGLLSGLVKNALRGKKTASGVWFRNVREQELGPDGKFYRINVAAEFQYQEIG